jgi:hypothetical protein
MIALVLLYFVGKAFYDLAGLYNKSQWGFGILGALSYYAGQFLAAAIMGVVIAFVAPDKLESIGEGTGNIVMTLIAIPFGVLTCWGFYHLLKSQWSKKSDLSSSEDVLDGNLLNKEL